MVLCWAHEVVTENALSGYVVVQHALAIDLYVCRASTS